MKVRLVLCYIVVALIAVAAIVLGYDVVRYGLIGGHEPIIRGYAACVLPLTLIVSGMTLWFLVKNARRALRYALDLVGYGKDEDDQGSELRAEDALYVSDIVGPKSAFLGTIKTTEPYSPSQTYDIFGMM